MSRWAYVFGYGFAGVVSFLVAILVAINFYCWYAPLLTFGVLTWLGGRWLSKKMGENMSTTEKNHHYTYRHYAPFNRQRNDFLYSRRDAAKPADNPSEPKSYSPLYSPSSTWNPSSSYYQPEDR